MTKQAPPRVSTTTVEPFTRRLIHDFLEEKALKYLRDKDEDYLVIFRRDQAEDEMRVWFTANGPEERIYTIVCFAMAPPGRDLDHWCRVCNDWNRSRRWPKAHASNVHEGTGVTLTLEEHLDLQTGIHKALFDDFTQETLSGVAEFFDWLAGSVIAEQAEPSGGAGGIGAGQPEAQSPAPPTRRKSQRASRPASGGTPISRL